MVEFPSFYDDLTACHAELWRRLEEGVNDRDSAFHTPALATVDPHGRPQVRAVVLRQADRMAGTLTFHCDRRSEKASEIAVLRSAALQVYDPVSKIQVRVDGTAEIHADSWFAETVWTQSRQASQVVYGISPGPGTALAHGGDYALPETEEDILGGRENFCVVVIRAERLEFLYLDGRGHRRALWLRSEAGWVETWLAP
jgi:pyridoxamine 5'-phosphate oxidase